MGVSSEDNRKTIIIERQLYFLHANSEVKGK